MKSQIPSKWLKSRVKTIAFKPDNKTDHYRLVLLICFQLALIIVREIS